MSELSIYLRNLVVGTDTKVPLLNGRYAVAINFDNAATTPPLCSVMRRINEFAPWYSSVHRGTGYKSVFVSEIYEETRQVIKEFVKAGPDDIVIYTKNTTEGINILSHILWHEDSKQIILSTDMEHLSNDLPWRNRFKVEYVCVDEYGRISISDLEEKLRKYGGKIKLVTVTGASNVTGYITPIHQIARLAHRYGAKILVDGAQLVPHCPVNMKSCDAAGQIDYLVFSGHKMYAPFGIGVLIGPKETFSRVEPFLKGGGSVNLVAREFVEWDDSPYKDEAGTPNPMGIVALAAAMQTLSRVGMDVIHEYERSLIDYTIMGLSRIPGIRLYSCTTKTEARVSLISFDMPGIDHRLLAKILSYEAAIAVRSGLFCAHPYVEKLLKMTNEDLKYYHNNPEVAVPGLVRVSLGIYNNRQEIDVMLDLLNWVAHNTKYCIKKYSNLTSGKTPAGDVLLHPRKPLV